MMDERERRDIMLRAIHRYGEAAQIDMAVEEMAELTKALCKVKRATPGATTTAAIANVIEEIAGVQIMLDQLRLIFARSTDEVEEEKLRRLLGRLNSYAESNLYKATPDGKDKVVTTRGEVVSCEIVPGANATDAGYRPHWATCPQADRFKRGGRHHE